MLCLANIDEASIVEESEGLQALREKVKSVEDAELLKLCVSLELEISTLEPSEMKEFLDELNLEEPAINKLIRASYDLLNLQTFFTAGPKEVRAWPVRKQSLAPQAAGTIHTDFEREMLEALEERELLQEGSGMLALQSLIKEEKQPINLKS